MYLHVKQLCNTEYARIYALMHRSISWRNRHALLITSHKPIYTLGYRWDKPEFKKDTIIPIIKTDRGGNITYHGPGQIVFYPLCHLPSLNTDAVKWVHQIEQTMIRALTKLGLKGSADPKRPGIYVNSKKIASIGIRVKQSRSYHGIAINHDLDLTPFDNIAPCGYDDLEMTSINEHRDVSSDDVIDAFTTEFCLTFGLANRNDTQTA